MRVQHLTRGIVYSDGRRFDVAGRVEVAGQRSAGDEKAKRAKVAEADSILHFRRGCSLFNGLDFGSMFVVSTY